MQTEAQLIAETIAAQKKMFSLLASQFVAFKTETSKPVKAFTVNCGNCPNAFQCRMQKELGVVNAQLHCPLINSSFYKSVGRPRVAIPTQPKQWAKQLTSFINTNQQ